MATTDGQNGATPAGGAHAPTNTKEKRRRNLRVKKRARDSDDSSDQDKEEQGPRRQQQQAAPNTLQNSKRVEKNAMTFTTKSSNDPERKGFHTFESSGMEASVRPDDATRSMEDVGVRRLGGGGRGTSAGVVPEIASDDAGRGHAEKIYRGMQGYADHRAGFRGEGSRARAPGAGGGSQRQQAGPARPSANYRMTVQVDYQPDVCKDYKETGFCGFGDSCKFLHDRSDYKAGWQLDRDWNEAEKLRKEKEEKMMAGGEGADGDEKDGSDDGPLPFACLVCKEPWESPSCADPVVTTCGHYFCETCALKQNTKTGTCYTCGKGTRGIFNTANDIIKKFKTKL